MKKVHCMEDQYLSKKSLTSDIKLAVWAGSILIAITMAWGSFTTQLAENTKDLQVLILEIKDYRLQQITMQNQVDIHEFKITRIEDDLHVADQSASLK